MRNRALLTLHRRMGLVSALFVILLSSTGLILHYSAELGLDARQINSDTLLSWYGMEAPPPAEAYPAGEAVVARVESALYFDERRLPGNYDSLRGVATTNFGFVVASSGQLVLLTDRGEVIEVLGSGHGVPRPIQRLGRSRNGDIIIEIPGRLLRADVDSLDFQPYSAPVEGLRWSESIALPQALARDISRDYAASMLSWERLLLDLHSGRLLGAFGVLLVDIMAILFLLMALTGVWIWSRRRPLR